MFVLHCHCSTEQRDTIKDSLLIDIDKSKLGQPRIAPPFNQTTPEFFWKSIYYRHWKVHQGYKPLAFIRAGLCKDPREFNTVSMCSEAIQESDILKYLGEARRAQGRARNKYGNHVLIDLTSISFRQSRHQLRHRNRGVHITGETLPRCTATYETG